MFVLKDEIKAWWPVEVKEPDDRVTGRFIQYQFDVEFRLIDRDEQQAQAERRDEILARAEASDLSKDDRKKILEELLAFDDNTYVNVISDWKGVVTEKKEEVPFSADLLVKALKRQHVREAIDAAYAAFQGGGGRRKN